MDSYLESLIKKGEGASAIEEMAASEEIITEEAEVATTEAEVVSEEKVEASESLDTASKKEVEKTSEEAKAEELQTLIEKQDKKAEKIVAKSEVKVGNNIGKTVSVKDIKVFNIPDDKSIFKLFTGNVIIKDEISGFSQIEYMKPGFGLVKGYTKEA